MNGAETDTTTPVNLIDLIDGLVEPSEPAPIPLVPETWGWVALALLVLALLGWGFWRWTAHRRANAYRRAALAELAEARTAAEVATILRRAALAAWPREDVASLTGDSWTDFIAQTGRGAFPQEAEAELRIAPWRDQTAPPSPGLRRAAKEWLRSHRAAPARAPAQPSGEAAA